MGDVIEEGNTLNRLKWDQPEFTFIAEVMPEIEEFDVCHRYEIVKEDIQINIDIWQLEGFISICFYANKSKESVFQLAFYCRDKCDANSSKGEIVFSDCVFVKDRFSYIENTNLLSNASNPFGNLVRLIFKEDRVQCGVE